MPISYKHKIYTTNGWLTSYKRKLYMGRTIEWNQLFANSVTSSNGVTISNNQDGTIGEVQPKLRFMSEKIS